MGLFDNLSKVNVRKKAEFFKPGQYIVEIDSVELFEGYKGTTLKIATNVLDSKGEESNEIGAHCAQIQKMDGEKRDIGLSTLMGFLTSIFDCNTQDKTDEEWATIVKSTVDDNELSGIKMRLDCFLTQTKNGNDFTIHQWLGLTEQDSFEEE